MRRPTLLALPLLTAACISTGEVNPRAELSSSISDYASVAYSVEAADPSMTNAAKLTKQLRDAISGKLHGSGLFANVYAEDQQDQAKLIVKVRLLEIVDASRDLLAGGVSRARFEVELFDVERSASIGVLEVEGNSKKKEGTIRVSGIDTDAFEDTIGRALLNGAHAFTEYLKSKA